MSTPENILASETASVEVQQQQQQQQFSCCGTRVAKNQITYFSQIGIIYGIIITAIAHLSLQSPDKELWLVLLSSSLGYILPTPGLKYLKPQDRKNELVLRNTSQ